MISICVLLATINDVKEFVGIVSQFDYDIDLISGRYAVDGKSIMGIFSLDLSKPIMVNIHSDSPDDFVAQVKKFIAE